jgi:UDP-N-acetylglucosamine diphosphorylase/glucosamine-1-phosphate N-acetyltransferase
VLGDHPIVIVEGDAKTVIEPHVVFDASGGPILVQPGAHIRAFSRIAGPCYIGRDVNVLGGDIAASSIGDVSKVRGELTNSVFIGHSNKGHDGFVGHSYLGRWVNLGASTVTSNLKNTYGPVALWTPSGVRDTGMQFLGTLFGDHVKTGIGLRLTTGTVLGCGANVYGSMPPKAVAPFSWGDGEPYDTYRPDKFAETAARVMSRRHVELSDRARRHLASVHAARWTVERES